MLLLLLPLFFTSVLGDTTINIREYNFSLGNGTYQRYGLFGSGPQWAEAHGTGYVRVSQGDKLHIRYENDLVLPLCSTVHRPQ